MKTKSKKQLPLLRQLSKSILFFSFIALTSCKKDAPLPKATQEGANTIGCKVNGKTWVADAGDSFSAKKYALLYNSKDQFALSCYQIKEDDNSTVQIAIEKLTATGTYPLNILTAPYPDDTRFKNHGSFERYKPSPSKRFVTNTTNTGWINISRLDTINRIIAGTFSFTAENLDGTSETVEVTDGRFDIKY